MSVMFSQIQSYVTPREVGVRKLGNQTLSLKLLSVMYVSG